MQPTPPLPYSVMHPTPILQYDATHPTPTSTLQYDTTHPTPTLQYDVTHPTPTPTLQYDVTLDCDSLFVWLQVDLLGHSIYKIIHPEDVSNMKDQFQGVTPESLENGEFQIVESLGTSVQLPWWLTPTLS